MARQLHDAPLAMTRLLTKSICIAFTLTSLLAGCATDDPDAGTDADWTRPTTSVSGDDRLPEPPVEVGFAKATPLQRKRILEAALGVDADRAVIQANALRGGACPREEQTAHGLVLHGGCSNGSLHVGGTATIQIESNGDSTYTFDHFDVRLDGGHSTYNGTARYQHHAGQIMVHAKGLEVTRTYALDDEADHVITTSTGAWDNIGDGKVRSLSISHPVPELPVWIGAVGVGRYAVNSVLTLETQAGTVSFDGPGGFEASSPGGGDCWNFRVRGVVLENACDLESLIVLDPH
ncbi:hypothetical protein BH11GEM2_BH11GEM2_33300 [soil metagenome]